MIKGDVDMAPRVSNLSTVFHFELGGPPTVYRHHRVRVRGRGSEARQSVKTNKDREGRKKETNRTP